MMITETRYGIPRAGDGCELSEVGGVEGDHIENDVDVVGWYEKIAKEDDAIVLPRTTYQVLDVSECRGGWGYSGVADVYTQRRTCILSGHVVSVFALIKKIISRVHDGSRAMGKIAFPGRVGCQNNFQPVEQKYYFFQSKMEDAITLRYLHPSRFSDLSTWSTAYPFTSGGRTYASVEHYVFDHLLQQMYTADILSKLDNVHLRQTFNDHVDDVLVTATRRVLTQTVNEMLARDPSRKALFETYRVIPSEPMTFVYMSDENIIWGVDSTGFGYNLLGLAYTRACSSVSPSDMNDVHVHTIYKASVLLRRSMQDAVTDIRSYIGMDVRSIVDTLLPRFPETSFLSTRSVMHLYEKDPYAFHIQNEIDYPKNLAGFVRKDLARHFNHYVRHAFHTMMIMHYFRYILRQHFPLYEERCVAQQFNRLSLDAFRRLAEMLYRTYNDPDTHASTFVFLSDDTRRALYDLEMTMLSPDEVEQAVHFIPFVYQVKAKRTLYVYDTITSDSFLQPADTRLSPVSWIVEKEHSLAQVCMCRLIVATCAQRPDDIFRLLRGHQDMAEVQHVLTTATQVYKKHLTQVALRLKADQSPFVRYMVWMTKDRQIEVQDPDPVFQGVVSVALDKIRKTLTSLIYPLVTLISDDVRVQDRVRFRLEDFKTVFEAYSTFVKRPLTETDFDDLQARVFRDPSTLVSSSSSTMIPPPSELALYLGTSLCTETCRSRVWSFLVSYVTHLSPLVDDDMSLPTRPVVPIASILSYLLTAFLTPPFTDTASFFPLAYTIVTGQRSSAVTWDASPMVLRSFYSHVMESAYQQYLPLDAYPQDVVLRLFHLTSRVEPALSRMRWEWLSSVCRAPMASTAYPSSLGATIMSALVSSDDVSVSSKKKKKTMKKMMMSPEKDDEEQQGDYLTTLYKDVGIDDSESEEEEDEGDESESDEEGEE